MNKLTAIAIAAMLSVSTPAFAQTATTLSPGATDPALPTQGNADFNMFIEGFSSADFTSAYDELDSASSVALIKLSGMANADAALVGDAFGARANDITALREKVAASPKAMQALDVAGLTADSVVAIQAAADGSITLYVNDFDA